MEVIVDKVKKDTNMQTVIANSIWVRWLVNLNGVIDANLI